MPLSNDPNVLKSLVDEKKRLSTFDDWKVPFIAKEALARNGFYYRGPNDHVVCIFCGVELANWEEGDVPEQEHLKYSPDCALLAHTTDSVVRVKSEKECGCVIETRRRRPTYADLNVRFNSFEDWPISMKQTPKVMAQAGFYYTGVGDKVSCFSCDLGVYKWEESDDPWVEHAKWSPECLYVQQEKGEEFIQKVAQDAADKLEKEKQASEEIETSEETTKKLLCTVCMAQERSVVSMPCRHLATCKKCNSTLVKCPVCRTEEKEAVPVIIP